MGSTPFPFWDKQKQTVESGIYCVGCVSHYHHRPFYANRAYLTCNIPQHFAMCRFAVKFKSLPADAKDLGEKFLVNADGQIEDIQPEEEKGGKRERTKRTVSIVN